MTQKMRYIQLGLEASIPLLGFFFWEWSLYFILLFYFLDLIAAEIIMHMKSRKIANFRNTAQATKEWRARALFSGIMLVVGITVIHGAMLFIQDGIQFWNEAVAFWNYKEMGIKQGYLFVPLILILSYQQYKMEFLLPARYRTYQMKDIWVTHTRALIVIAGFAGICTGLSFFVSLPEIVYVFGIVVFTVAYKLKFSN
jgi:hypothetical protein